MSRSGTQAAKGARGPEVGLLLHMAPDVCVVSMSSLYLKLGDSTGAESQWPGHAPGAQRWLVTTASGSPGRVTCLQAPEFATLGVWIFLVWFPRFSAGLSQVKQIEKFLIGKHLSEFA